MKKKVIFILMAVLGLRGAAHATHLYSLNAANINSGTLDPARLPASSVTLQGNDISISSMNQAIGALALSTQNISNLLFAPTTYAVADLIITTQASNGNILVASATFIDIMGVYAVNFGTTADISKAGAGGLDTGAVAAAKNYFLHAIANNSGSLVGVIFSLSPTNPALPTGYTKSRYLCRIRTDGGSAIIPVFKHGNKIHYWQQQNILVTNNMATAWTAINISNLISSKTISVELSFNVDGSPGTITTIEVRVRGTTNITVPAAISNNDIVGLLGDGTNGTAWFGRQSVEIYGVPEIQYNGVSGSVGLSVGLVGYTEEN